MRSIDALPLELWLSISSYLDYRDLLKFRLVAPRGLLSTINATIFDNIVIDVDGTDDLPRWQDGEIDGVVTKRIEAIANSSVLQHVRVLTLRLVRPYSLSGYYEQKFNVKRYPAKYQAAALKKEPWKRLSSFFHRSKDDQDSPKEEQTAIQRQFLRKVNYASELASALQKLFKATDLVHTIRLVQPEGYNSEYDIVYPSVYARVLVRLLTAIQFVDLPEGTILALMDLPITHLEEAGLHLDSRVALNSLSKFGSIFLRTRRMGYAVIPPGSQKYTQESFDPHIRIASSSLGMQLIRGIGANSTQFQSLTLVDCTKTVVLNVLLAPSQWETLRHLEIEHFCAIPDLFVPFMQNVLPHLETLSLQSVQLQPSALCPVTWISLFDSWVKLKEEMDAVHKWYLRTCYFAYLSPIPFVGSLSHEKIMHYVRILVVNKPNEKPRLAVSEGAS